MRRRSKDVETVDMSARLRQIGLLESLSAPQGDSVDAAFETELLTSSPRTCAEPHAGRIYVAAAHGERRFKTVTWRHQRQSPSA